MVTISRVDDVETSWGLHNVIWIWSSEEELLIYATRREVFSVEDVTDDMGKPGVEGVQRKVTTEVVPLSSWFFNSSLSAANQIVYSKVGGGVPGSGPCCWSKSVSAGISWSHLDSSWRRVSYHEQAKAPPTSNSGTRWWVSCNPKANLAYGTDINQIKPALIITEIK